MTFLQNLNNVNVGQVGQFLVNDNGNFKVIKARLVSADAIEKIVSASKPAITTAYMLPTCGRADIITLSLSQTLEVIDGVRKQGCKHGAEVHFEETCSSGATYTPDEAEKLGEGIGYKFNGKGEKIICVLPIQEQIKRGVARVISGVMRYEGNGENDLYNASMYKCVACIDSLSKQQQSQC